MVPEPANGELQTKNCYYGLIRVRNVLRIKVIYWIITLGFMLWQTQYWSYNKLPTNTKIEHKSINQKWTIMYNRNQTNLTTKTTTTTSTTTTTTATTTSNRERHKMGRLQEARLEHVFGPRGNWILLICDRKTEDNTSSVQYIWGILKINFQ